LALGSGFAVVAFAVVGVLAALFDFAAGLAAVFAAGLAAPF
jgi:hypothetical protein